MIKFHKITLTPLQILSAGFMLVILCGALLLMLPAANRGGQALSFIDAVFTATSATCVTGLVVFDTYTRFTVFGQIIILCLIQIGGLGFVSVGIFFSMAIGKRIGLRERFLLKESISALKIGGVVRLVRRAVFGTLLVELLGALLLATRFCPRFGLGKGLWYSVFHAISSFCNAGFDLMGSIEPFCSLIPFVGDVVVNLTIISLIIIGGIGFIVWDDIIDNKWRFRHYRLQTKIVLSMTLALIVLGAAAFYFFEADFAFAGMSASERLLASLFQSATPRTTGFSTIDPSALSESGSFLTLFLMLVGASPGSTGGGIKTTTFFVILASAAAYLRSRDDINVFKRKIEDKAVQRAYNGAFIYIITALIGTLIITTQDAPLETALFEAISAIGTVGLSKGLTPGLTGLSKAAVIALMYIGRVGSLSVLMAVTDRRIKTKISNIEEKIITG